MYDAGEKFYQLLDRLDIKDDHPHGLPALEYWIELTGLGLHDDRGNLPLDVVSLFEDALDARIHMFNFQIVLGKEPWFYKRTDGPLKDVPAMHPAINALSRIHERIHKTMNDLTARAAPETKARLVGLHESTMKLMKESDGALAEIFGFKPGEGGPLEPKFPAGETD